VADKYTDINAIIAGNSEAAKGLLYVCGMMACLCCMRNWVELVGGGCDAFPVAGFRLLRCYITFAIFSNAKKLTSIGG
jgi:hypothetical protein